MNFSADPFIIAHRGASAYAPENTLAAFAKLPSMNAEWVEFDVFISQDQVPMVFHDDSLRRVTGHRGAIGDYTCEALQKFDAGTWFSPKFSAETIPSLLTVLTTLTSFAKGINVEIKSPGAAAVTPTVTAIVALIETHFPELPIWYSSFDEACLQAMRIAKPDCVLGWLAYRWHRRWQDFMNRLQCQTIHINHAVLTEKRVKELSQEYPVFAYTVNQPERAQQLFDWGVRAVYSDYPDLLTRAQLK